MIRAEKIFKNFGDQAVLKGIDFTFEAGKTNLVIGKSGSEKNGASQDFGWIISTYVR